MIGQKISHYRIEAELGRGGMGVVYRAHDEVLQRDVALKVLSGEILSQKERRERILSEARAASALNHPGITTIYEVAEDGNQILLVMELAQGKTLRVQLADGPLEPRALARLGTSIAETLDAAHEEGVIHGDIKPENVIVLPNERTKLLDFGIARQMAVDTLTLTKSAEQSVRADDSRIAGTLAYMAPELLRGEATDARADLFSLGVLLYELACGRRPFPGPTVSALTAQILEESTPPISDGRHILPPELGRIIRKLLEKKPEARYQSAREVKVDLTNLARDLEIGTVLPPAVAGKRALAVLPFKLLTPNPEDDYLSVALADAVINRLSASGELLVRPASTVQRYARQTVDPLAAARELNVQVVVDGSIQKFGPRLRVHFQAWNAADGASLLSAKHDSEMADLFGLQDKIGESLARALGLRAAQAGVEPAEPPTKNPVAYQLYLRAAEKLSKINRWDTRTAIELLEETTKLDLKFADAWAHLAEARLLMAVSFEPKIHWVRDAEQAVRRAIALNPRNAEAQCACGRLLWSPARGFQNAPALRALSRALKLNPGCYYARMWQGIIFLHVGLIEKSIEMINATLAVDPDDAFALYQKGQASSYAQNYEQAEECYSRSLSINPSHMWANLLFPGAPLYLGKIELAEKKIQEAKQMVMSDALLTSWEAMIWAKRGEKRKAQLACQKVMRERRVLTYTHHAWHNVAAALAVMGKYSEAVAVLRKASKTGLPNYPAFRDDPHFEPMQSFAPFRRLLVELKRECESFRREFASG